MTTQEVCVQSVSGRHVTSSISMLDVYIGKLHNRHERDFCIDKSRNSREKEILKVGPLQIHDKMSGYSGLERKIL